MASRMRALVGPGELVTLFGAFDHVVSQELAEFVEVDGLFDATVAVDSFGQTLGEQRPNLFYISIGHIRRLHLQVFHGDYLVVFQNLCIGRVLKKDRSSCEACL